MAKSKTVETSLRSAGRRLKSMIANTDRSDVTARYEISVFLKETLAKAKSERKAITVLAKEIAYNRQTLYRMAGPAKAWSATAFRKMVREVNRSGWPLTWSHYEMLARFASDRRDAMMERALKEAMTVAELAAELSPESKAGVEDPNVETPATESKVRIAGDLLDWVQEFEEEIKLWDSKLKDDVKMELAEGKAPMLAETVERMTRAAKAMEVMADELKRLLPSAAPAMGQLHEAKPLPFVPRPFGSAQP